VSSKEGQNWQTSETNVVMRTFEVSILSILVWVILSICLMSLKYEMFHAPTHRHFMKLMIDPWKDVPSLELALRMNSNPKFIKLYSTWFTLSLKVFWPQRHLNLTLILDDENKEDHATGEMLSKVWPWPKIVYLHPWNESLYKNQRQRMYLSYFYPEEYVTAEYVGFVDSDTMFTTVVTPKMLFVNGRPTIQARIGEPFWEQGWECWSDVTEFMIGEKEALQCMSYFPVVFKVAHIIELRNFAEKRLGAPFHEIFRKSLTFENKHFKDSFPLINDCICQYSIFCNYVWYFHREEYDFHLQIVPNGKWNGERRRESQQTAYYINAIAPMYNVPKPRVAIHSRHYLENGVYHSGSFDISREPYASHMRSRIQEGFCNTLGMDWCPNKCHDFNTTRVQLSLYSFEIYEWIWDERCLGEQKKHIDEVKEMMNYDRFHGIKTFHIRNCSPVFQ